MVIAFQIFKEINSMENIQDKHRAWLRLHEGLKFGRGEEGHYKAGEEWTKSKYSDSKYTGDINLIGRLKNQTRIEFDGDPKDAQRYLQEVLEKVRENEWGYILSTHNGKCNYIWVEFTEELSDKEIESFLAWIAPVGSEIDLNFASSKKIFPCLYAVHWKHSYHREMPIEYKEGKQIDFNSLNIKPTKSRKTKTMNQNGFVYSTFKKATNSFISDKIDMAKEFSKIQPVFYDKSGMFWLWNFEAKFWEMFDEIDILNMLNSKVEADTINSTERGEILQALKQVGRMNLPKPLPNTWVQFQNGIVDISDPTMLRDATPEYFTVNPIPWKVGKSEDTPIMDKVFTEWVGEKYVKTLYQIIAYSIIPDYPIHRIFCFIGSGMNGKSKFLDLHKHFIGANNVCSTELDNLISSRFEVARLYKKLLCQMGETNFGELNKTSMLKKLSGGDLIGFEYKGKTPFESNNYAKIVISTNNLPATSDKTVGFYRRWMIIDFPNQFTEKKDILKDIPEEEYENLAFKCIKILTELLEKREFENEGTIEQRMAKYEAKSNFLEQFLHEMTQESLNSYITKADFYKKFTAWSVENRHREMSEMSVTTSMRRMGIEEGKKYFEWLFDGKGGQARVWFGIKWKD